MTVIIKITTTVVASFFPPRLTTESIRQEKVFFSKLREVRLQMEYTIPDYFIQYLDPFFVILVLAHRFFSLVIFVLIKPSLHIGAELY